MSLGFIKRSLVADGVVSGWSCNWVARPDARGRAWSVTCESHALRRLRACHPARTAQCSISVHHLSRLSNPRQRRRPPFTRRFASEPGRRDLWIVRKQRNAVLIHNLIHYDWLDVPYRQRVLIVRHG